MPKTAIKIVPVSTLIVRLKAFVAYRDDNELDAYQAFDCATECGYILDVENTLREVTPNPEESRQLRALLQKLVYYAGDDRVRLRAEELLEKGW